MRPSGVAFVAAVLALSAALQAAAATPAKAPAKSTAVTQLKDPMIFYLAQGEPNACGLGCDEWIVAEGEITHGTAERMRAFLKRHGAKAAKRPIYFSSPGGVTSESLTMGRLMRERGMTARVGRTHPFDCANASARDCAAAKRSGRALVARLTVDQGGCFSACVYAIVGARLREVAPEARLGIHASKTVIMGVPKGVVISAQTRARFRSENHQAIRRYLVEMAIPPGLLDAAEKVPHESIHVLTREEIVRFKIDTRNAVESGWIYVQRPSNAIVIKSFEETALPLSRRWIVRLSCTGENLVFGLLREVGPQDDNAAVSMRLIAASQSFELPPSVRSGPDDDKRYDMRGVIVPARVLEIAASEDSIQIEPQPEAGKKAFVRFSTLGLSSALTSLTQHCDQASAGGTALVPRQSP